MKMEISFLKCRMSTFQVRIHNDIAAVTGMFSSRPSFFFVFTSYAVDGMLSEGWDAKTVTHIMGLRAFTS